MSSELIEEINTIRAHLDTLYEKLEKENEMTQRNEQEKNAQISPEFDIVMQPPESNNLLNDQIEISFQPKPLKSKKKR